MSYTAPHTKPNVRPSFSDKIFPKGGHNISTVCMSARYIFLCSCMNVSDYKNLFCSCLYVKNFELLATQIKLKIVIKNHEDL